jgi:hypothetical protein
MKPTPDESSQSEVRPSTSPSSSQHLHDEAEEGETADAAPTDAPPDALLEDQLRAVSESRFLLLCGLVGSFVWRLPSFCVSR